MRFILSFVFIVSGLMFGIAHAEDAERFGRDTLSPPPLQACNGGSCETKNGTVLSCPTSGGPTCSHDNDCVCSCELQNHEWVATNACKHLTAITPGDDQLEFDLE